MSAAHLRIRWRLVLAVWTAYGLVVGVQQYAVGIVFARPVPLWRPVLLQLSLAWGWALLTPLILSLGRRFPLERGRWVRSLAVHLAASATIVFLVDLFYVLESRALGDAAQFTVLRATSRLFVFWLVTDGLLYWIVLVVGRLVERERSLRDRETAGAALEARLAQAQLSALQAQLHPHFLFNALHTIGTLVRTGDAETAVRVTAGLGDLMRRLLDEAGTQHVPLKDELEFVRRYLDIEQVRFRDRLRVTIHATPEALDAAVPPLVLQPLVENAIRHGIAAQVRGGMVVVGARRFDGRLLLTVRDDGPGVAPGGPRPGVGLATTRDRLSRLYGREFELAVENVPDGGVEARVAIPYRMSLAEWSREE